MASKTVVIAFGRMNPPTTGHEKLIQFTIGVAQKRGADVIFFASPTQDPKKNPLPFKVKVNFLKRMFPRVTFNENPVVKTPFDALRACSALGYRTVVLVVGSDRVAGFETFRNYIKAKGIVKNFDASKDVDLDDYEVVPVPGERDPDADDVSGMSASKMRKFAADNDFKSFASGTPTKNMNIAQQLFSQTRAFMGLK